MRVLPEPISFDWDEGNIRKNLAKHNVSVQEAEEVFLGEPFITLDNKHSVPNEVRYHTLGRTKTNRKLFAAFITRDRKIRIISIRDMTFNEEQVYEELKKNS